MDLRHVRTFVTVAEVGTVSGAAAHLHVAQPALSRQIALLEEAGPLVDAAAGSGALMMLERGEIHLVQTVVSAIGPDQQRFAAYPLAPMEMLAACPPKLRIGGDGKVEIASLAPYPLLQATQDFAMRRSFDAACRVAGFTPNNVLECRAPHALLAMAEAGHGVAIIPSALRIQRYRVRVLRVTYRGKPLQEPLTILSDQRRPLPGYAKPFCAMLAEHVRKGFPLPR